ncbi:hypothetical protein AAFF_G00312100 [Aldrovandia affinis]|uniref:C2H2-type domain-containing protein n=1 Tax=Aldrovandia affinis TaxID=143900 RepID=A0AAD7SNN4_9TELE|nr:hypothetical protein AAFF_G00312100 [Aldrovandia affinis]
MEEQEKGKSESQDHPCEEQTHSLSVVLSVEEEAAEMRSDWGLNSAEEDDVGVANGFGKEEGDKGATATPRFSPGTTYWSVSEGPGSPRLLSPVAGPSRGKPGKRQVERASRTGSSRIPGRDHRRYYHEYWRGEFLMDFDAQRHHMLCMVCGSSLATLKLSTIKRHIQQKHPESLLWTTADKEAIRAGWDSHLSLQGAPSPAHISSAGAAQGQEVPLNSVHLSPGEPDPGILETGGPCGNGGRAPSPSPAAPLEPRQPDPEPPAHMLERYLNDSLHAWFRQEFLMEYRAEEGRLVCMVCAGQVPSLHLDHIKRHVLDGHPVSLLYSAEERHSILHTWALKQEISPLRECTSIKPDPESDGGGAGTGTLGDAGGDGAQSSAQIRSHRGRLPKRWRLGYLVARCPKRRALVCMVCSQSLPVANAGTFRRHIRECHPETSTLTRPERRALADTWSKRMETAEPTLTADKACKIQQGCPPDGTVVCQTFQDQWQQIASLQQRLRRGGAETKQEDSSAGIGTAPEEGAMAARHGHYPGKDQRRNYQERWRTEYLMEYDGRRRGLVCVVCGAALATLKVSTIKRHIQHVHPQSLGFSPAQREEALRNFSHPAVVAPPPSALSRTHGCPPEGSLEGE